MIVFILSLFVDAINADQRVLLISDTPTTSIIYPQGKNVSLEKSDNTNFPNPIGDYAMWLGIEGMNGWPDQYQATFTASFFADATEATLILTADDVFIAYINGRPIGTGQNWLKFFTYKINLTCGVNNLTIVVINYLAGSPGALIFKVVQDTTESYKCYPAAYYNYGKCNCQCLASKAPCQNSLKQWMSYPICGCKCANQLYAGCNPAFQTFNGATCACECRYSICPKGFEQDPQSCQCKCQAQACPAGKKWSYHTCSCQKVACTQLSCTSPKIWSSSQCSCTCNAQQTCASPKVWEDSSCSCVCPTNVACPASQIFSSSTCTCQ